jgi:WD domain, G-beta repeat
MVVNARAELITTVPTESQVEHAAVTPDGHLVFGGRGDGVVLVWNVADWSCRTSIAAHADHISPLNSISAVAVSPDSRHGLSAGADRKVCIWELATGAEVRVLDHPAKVTACGYTPDGTHIVSSARDGSTWIWDAHEPAPGRLLAHAPTPVRFCVVSPDGQFVITAHLDRSTTVRELATGRTVASIRLAGWSSSFDIHPWRPFLACGDQAGNVSLIEILGIEYGPIVVTARERAERAGLTVRCPRCRLQHHVDHAELGGEHRCPTPGCALPLRLNSFYSSKTPPRPAAAGPRSSTPAPSAPTDGDHSWASWEAEAERLRLAANQRDSARFKKGPL